MKDKQTKKSSRPIVPEWLTSRAGITDSVPQPWTKVKVKDDTLSCWGRDHLFAGKPLPSQIVSRDEPLLARPIELVVSTGGQTLRWNRCQVKEVERHSNGRHATRTAVGMMGDLLLKATVRLYYEGAIKVDITLEPTKPVQVDALSVEIPVRKKQAGLIWAQFGPRDSHPLVFTFDELPEEGCQGPFDLPLVWLGTEERGLGWFCESSEGWDTGDDALELRKEGNAVVFAMKFIRAPQTIDHPITFSFGLQANPWKPAPKGCEHYNIYHYHWLYDFTDQDLKTLHDQGVRVLIFHSAWSHLHAYPETAYQKDLHALVKRVHQHGMKLLVYFGSEFSHGAKEWPTWGIRWAIGDPNHGYTPLRVPRYPAPHICFQTEWPDFMIHGIERLLRKYDLDGVYLDGWPDWTGNLCKNRLHGCGYLREDGTVGHTYPIWACRDLMERVYNAVKSYKPDGLVDLHANPGIAFVSGPFGTSCFAGEGYAGDYRQVSLPGFRALHMGLAQWGVVSELIASADLHFGMAIGLLHNVLPRSGAYELSHQVTAGHQACVWKARDAFGVSKAEWHPYWKNQSLVKAAPDPVKVSFWNRPGEGGLFVVSNLQADETSAQLQVNWKKLGYTGELETLDLLPSGGAVAISGSRVSLDLPAGKCRLIFFAPPKSPLWPRMRRVANWVSQQSFAHVQQDEWLLLGPFGEDYEMVRTPTGGLEVPPSFRGLETEYIPESKPIDLSASYLVATGEKQPWLKVVAEDHQLPMRPEVVEERWQVVYAYTRIHFPTLVPSHQDNPVDIHLRSPHAFKLWVNGEEAFTHGGAGTLRYGQRRFYSQEDVAPAVLHPGWNSVLVKMVARHNVRIFFKVTGRGDQKLPPFLIQAVDQAED